MTMLLIQAGVLLLFLAASKAWPRAAVPVLSHNTWLNLITGGSLFALRVAVYTLAWSLPLRGLVSMSALTHPLLQFAFLFVLGDLARYLLHRAHHEFSFLWQFHRVHHSSEQLNATSGLRMHVVDFIQLSLMPVLLFDLLFDTSSFDLRTKVALGTVIATMDAFQHADLRFPLRHPLARAWYRVFNTPHFHSWHHVRDWGTHHGNYGQTLVIWDRLLGTAVDGPAPATDLGLSADQALSSSWLGMQLLQRPGEVSKRQETAEQLEQAQ